MRIIMFYHSVQSDWGHGNAHFLRGVATELTVRGHDVRVYEPKRGWSLTNLLREHGREALGNFRKAYPAIKCYSYDTATLDLGRALEGADLVVVNEWTPPGLVKNIGREREKKGFMLLYHDSHHRSVTDRKAMASLDLGDYDGVLAQGSAIRDIYLSEGWARRAFTWHEAADIRVMRPLKKQEPWGDLVFIGNWGDEKSTDDIPEFLIDPVRALDIKARVYGVRYPADALAALEEAGIEYGGWLPDFGIPNVYARFRVTIHIPPRPYVNALPGVPTARPFEALACGIPMVSAPWDDRDGLFTPGRDYLVAGCASEVKKCVRDILRNPALGSSLAAYGRRTIIERHTCSHRVDELLRIIDEEILEMPRVKKRAAAGNF